MRPGTRPSLQPWVSRDSRGTPPTAGASRHPRMETGSRPEEVSPTLPFLTETKRDAFATAHVQSLPSLELKQKDTP